MNFNSTQRVRQGFRNRDLHRLWILPAVIAVLLVSGACGNGGDSPIPDPSSSARPGAETAGSGLGEWRSDSNVLIVTMDTTRADAVGRVVDGAPVTPHLDRVARVSHRFQRCSTAVPQTLPAHVSLFSGLNPGTHGIRKNFSSAVADGVPLMADAFKGAGFETGAFISAFVLDRRFGLDRGFGTFDPPSFGGRNGSIHDERRADATVKAAIDWFRNRTAPWFLWVHLFDPHAPYDPPEPFASRFDPYFGEVAFMDAQINRLFEALKTDDLWDDTALVVCGDHGEGLGDHGEPAHGILLYESTTRVPFLIHLPGQKKGMSHAETVSLVDLAPTVASVVKMGGEFDGKSLLPLLEGTAGTGEERYAYIESLEGFFRSGWSPIYALVQGPWKFIEAPRPELYDVVADPGETANVIDRFPEIAGHFRDRLAMMIPEETLRSGPSPALSDEEHEALARLGYVAGNPAHGLDRGKNPADLIHLAEVHQQALSAFQAGRMEKAARLFRRELEEDSQSPLIHRYLGASLAERNPHEAERHFRRAIELRSDFEEPYVDLCLLLERQGRIPELLEAARTGIENTPDTTGRLHFFRASGSLRTRGFSRAVQNDLEQAIVRGRSPKNAYRLRAAIRLREMKDLEGAFEDLERCVALLSPEERAVLHSDPMFRLLHGHPRFERLLAGDGGSP